MSASQRAHLVSFGLDLSEDVAVAHDSLHELQHPQACLAHGLHLLNGGIESPQEAWRSKAP